MSDVPVAPTPTAVPTPSATPSPATTKSAGLPSGADTSAKTSGKSQAVTPDSGASTAPATPAEVRAEIERRKYKLKIDGREQELELADDEVATRLQKGLAAEKRFAEAAQTKKDFKAIVDAIKADPWKALNDPVFGLDMEKLAEERLIQKYTEEQLPEDQKKLKQYEREIEQYKIREKKAQEQYAAQVREQQEQKAFQDVEKTFLTALDSSNLPKNTHTLRMMAEIAMANLENGVEATPQQLAAEVRERLQGLNKHVITGLKGEHLVNYLGEDIVKEVLRHSLEKHRAKKAATQPEPFKTSKTAPQDDGEGLEDTRQSKRTRQLLDWRKFTRDT